MKVKDFLVNTRLPDRIRHLKDLAMNMWFSWNYEAVELFVRLGYNPSRSPQKNYWEESDQNPVKLLSLIPQEELLEASRDDSFVANLDRVYRKFTDYFDRQTWFERRFPDNRDFHVAYFSCEYGLDECLPVYSGGLGILSGDHLKSCSDLGIPLVGIGLLYQEGYFQQYLNNDGWQQERYPTNDWYNMPVSLMTTEQGEPITVSIQLNAATVICQIWKVQVGRIPLYLLDTNLPKNTLEHRQITHRLYGGDRDMRIRQEIVLGVGGVKALEAMNIHPAVFHINEGHSAFLSIERIRHLMEVYHLNYKEAWEIVRTTNIFTTHTPVPAGNEHFSLELIRKYFVQYAEQLGLTMDEFIELGQEIPGVSKTFCLTALALRMSSLSNGVSKLHGETTRKMWHFLWKEVPVEEVPITHITNGIHTYSWLSNRMKELLERYLGPKILEEPEDPAIWQRIDNIPDSELWRVRQIRRERCISFARKRLATQLKQRGSSPKEISQAEESLNSRALTIGFSRRFASYKRAALLFYNLERLNAILNNPECPVQIIFSGKAHPQDTSGKELIRKIIQIANEPQFRNSIVFLENYDISVASYMVQGCDIWLNTPRRPLEASGTSGMKAAINGALNVSILDGWWCEGYGEQNGWAIGSGEEYDDPEHQDEIESEALYRLLEKDIIPLFYERDRTGLPRQWIKMIKSSMKTLGSYFNTHRMLADYVHHMYLPAFNAGKMLRTDNGNGARELAMWRDKVNRSWYQVSVSDSYLDVDLRDIQVGDNASIFVDVWLGKLSPDDVTVQAYYGPLDSEFNIVHGQLGELKPVQTSKSGYRYHGILHIAHSGRHGYAIRVMPHHKHLLHAYTPLLIKWE